MDGRSALTTRYAGRLLRCGAMITRTAPQRWEFALVILVMLMTLRNEYNFEYGTDKMVEGVSVNDKPSHYVAPKICRTKETS